MGVSDTFTILAALPVEHRLPYVEAAIREPFTELQAAALDALSDPEGLNRPDLVIQHFFDLTADGSVSPRPSTEAASLGRSTASTW